MIPVSHDRNLPRRDQRSTLLRSGHGQETSPPGDRSSVTMGSTLPYRTGRMGENKSKRGHLTFSRGNSGPNTSHPTGERRKACRVGAAQTRPRRAASRRGVGKKSRLKRPSPIKREGGVSLPPIVRGELTTSTSCARVTPTKQM